MRYLNINFILTFKIKTPSLFLLYIKATRLMYKFIKIKQGIDLHVAMYAIYLYIATHEVVMYDGHTRI